MACTAHGGVDEGKIRIGLEAYVVPPDVPFQVSANSKSSTCSGSTSLPEPDRNSFDVMNAEKSGSSGSLAGVLTRI